MKLIAKVIASMLSKDATQQWTGQTSAAAGQDVSHWDGFSEYAAVICHSGAIRLPRR